MKILHVDSSANVHRSHSKNMAVEFLEAWKGEHPDDTITHRDLGASPVPPINDLFIAAIHTPSEQRSPEQVESVALSNKMIDELIEADTYVFAVPMYNFSIPALFKAYIDQVVISGRTWSFGPNGFEGLLKGKRALVISSRSADYGKGGPMAAMDFHEPYLRTVFGFLGITDVAFVPLVNSPMADEATKAEKLEEARSSLKEVATRWANPGQEPW